MHKDVCKREYMRENHKAIGRHAFKTLGELKNGKLIGQRIYIAVIHFLQHELCKNTNYSKKLYRTTHKKATFQYAFLQSLR